MSEQTKRQWTAEARKYSEEYWVGESHYVVGPIDSWTGIITGFRHREDATLVAAAPDLLAALDALLKRYSSLVNSGDCGNWNPEEEEEIIAARAAIAKARDMSLPANTFDGNWWDIKEV